MDTLIEIIRIVLMTTGAGVWFLVLAIAGGFIYFMADNKICQMKARKMAKRRVKNWVQKNG